MDLISRLADADQWKEFYEYKQASGHLTQKDLQKLADFIENKEYLECVTAISKGGTFAPPILERC